MLLIGENDFDLQRYVKAQITSFDGKVEIVDGRELELTQLPDLLMGATLFQDKRLVVISQLSENKALWNAFPNWLERLSDDIALVLIEPKPDKRTATYKTLLKLAEVQEFPAWTIKDSSKAVQWTLNEASRHGLELTKAQAQQIVARIGVNQWDLFHSIQKLSLVENITTEVIEEIIEHRPEENVFALFETALRGDVERTHELIETLRRTHDAYQTFGLLSSQIVQLVALARASKPASEVAKDIGAHPYVLSKLSHYAERMGSVDIHYLVAAAADTDIQMKSSGLEPWLLIEHFLIKIARR